MKIKIALFDMILTGLALFLALWFQLDESITAVYFEHFEQVIWPVVLLNLVAFFVFGVYRRLWFFYTLRDYLLLGGAVLLGVAAVLAYGVVFNIMLPRSVFIIYCLLVFIFSGGMRFILRKVVDLDEVAKENSGHHAGDGKD